MTTQEQKEALERWNAFITGKKIAPKKTTTRKTTKKKAVESTKSTIEEKVGEVPTTEEKQEKTIVEE